MKHRLIRFACCAVASTKLYPLPVAAQTTELDPATAASEEEIEVFVQRESVANRLRNSAESVKVVATEVAQRQAADLGEVLARSQGIGVRRAGGLGSGTRFSLNGLTDDQVRFFLDGLPLEHSGYSFGVANVPVNLVERVEVYSGVVPIRLGADALGGAVNLVTKKLSPGTHASASYEVGSFSSHRVTLAGQHFSEASQLYQRADAFWDGALNRYSIDVEATDARGKLYPVHIPRFHDRYRATGANVEVGIVNQPWARRLAVRGFGSTFHRELQHNFSMTIPYGGATYGERSYGGNLRYEQDFGENVSLNAVAGHSRVRGQFLDIDACSYSWFGECIVQGVVAGETDRSAHDILNWENASFGRLNLQWLPAYDHALRVSVAPTFLSRTGDERRLSPSVRDPLTAQRDLFSLVNGVEYEGELLNGDLQNIAFVKQYTQVLNSEDPVSLRGELVFRDKDRTNVSFGAGNSLRYHFTPWLTGKLAYEWATRLPHAEEVFGDAAFVRANLELQPESSHNFNLGARLNRPNSGVGVLRGAANLFLREMDQLIFLAGSDMNDPRRTYQNVYAARSQGIEASAGWTSLGEYLSLDTNVTYQAVRNSSNDGPFGAYNGDRIPNRPYLFANGSARFQVKQLAAPQDELALTWHSRYVKEFFRSWESVGIRESKQVIPSQLVHSLSLVYLLKSQALTSSSSLEVQNIGDARVYDFFGAQRPGRAVFLKTTIDY